MRSRLSRLLSAIFLGVCGWLGWAEPAAAACHSFTVSASPAMVKEGGKVTVTVQRDSGVNPSQVRVSSIDETATGGNDFEKVDRTVSFTAETSQSFTVAIIQDTVAEPAEVFRLHLSDAAGCAVNPAFSLGPDFRVTIEDDDGPTTTAASTTSSAPDPATSEAPPSTNRPVPSAVPTPSDPGRPSSPPPVLPPLAVPGQTTLPEEVAIGELGDDEGSLWIAVGIAALALAVPVAGFLLRGRLLADDPDPDPDDALFPPDD